MAKDIDGETIKVGDVVEGVFSHQQHKVFNITDYLIVYNSDNGDLIYRCSKAYRILRNKKIVMDGGQQ